MPPILPSGKNIISTVSDTETYYVGPLKHEPDTVGILPGTVDPPPLSTLDNIDSADEHNISIDGRLVDEKEDGKLFLRSPEPGIKQKWRIIQSGEDKYQIGGEKELSGLLCRFHHR